MIKPEKEAQFGQYITTSDDPEPLKKHLLIAYKKFVKKHTHNTSASWCIVNAPEWIIREPNDDPLNYRTTVALKWKALGRAFYIKRTFRHPKEVTLHSHKKCVPKRKRGKQKNLRKKND